MHCRKHIVPASARSTQSQAAVTKTFKHSSSSVTPLSTAHELKILAVLHFLCPSKYVSFAAERFYQTFTNFIMEPQIFICQHLQGKEASKSPRPKHRPGFEWLHTHYNCRGLKTGPSTTYTMPSDWRESVSFHFSLGWMSHLRVKSHNANHFFHCTFSAFPSNGHEEEDDITAVDVTLPWTVK